MKKVIKHKGSESVRIQPKIENESAKSKIIGGKEDTVLNPIDIKSLEELMDLNEIQAVRKMLMGLHKPKSNIIKYLENAGIIHEIDTNELEKYLSVYTEWQNYYSEQTEVWDAIRTVAESQKNFFWGMAIKITEGTINEKKEVAYSNIGYAKAAQIYIEANSHYKVLLMKSANCDRGYKLVSRILAKRINIREL